MRKLVFLSGPEGATVELAGGAEVDELEWPAHRLIEKPLDSR